MIFLLARTRSHAHFASAMPCSMRSVHREVGKANEALVRIGVGLAANPSITEREMLLYVHATVAPFLLPQVLLGLFSSDCSFL